MTTKTTINSRRHIRLALCAGVLLLWMGAGTAFAEDDFSNIVHHIESRYHAHRNFRFLMSFAGLTAKAWQGTGVKDVKIAFFEDQRVFQSTPDREIEELMQSLGDSGWQPMVKSVSRRDAEHTYIYAKPLGKDLQVLVVNVEANEAVVVQVKLDSRKLDAFISDHSGGRHHHRAEGPGAGVQN